MDKNEYENNKLHFVCLAKEEKKACSTLKMNKFIIIKTLSISTRLDKYVKQNTKFRNILSNIPL